MPAAKLHNLNEVFGPTVCLPPSQSFSGHETLEEGRLPNFGPHEPLQPTAGPALPQIEF